MPKQHATVLMFYTQSTVVYRKNSASTVKRKVISCCLDWYKPLRLVLASSVGTSCLDWYSVVWVVHSRLDWYLASSTGTSRLYWNLAVWIGTHSSCLDWYLASSIGIYRHCILIDCSQPSRSVHSCLDWYLAASIGIEM